MGRVFKTHTSFEEAKKVFLEHISPLRESEEIALENCAGRVLAGEIIAGRNVPHYRRSAMDGYAVKASDTFGASPSSPVLLQLSGDVGDGNCKWVYTGAEVPEKADAVLMVEDTVNVGKLVEVRAQAYPGGNIEAVGEDIKSGARVFDAGHLLRPCDIAALASLGFTQTRVFRKPVVAIIPIGNELISLEKASEVPEKGKVLETNGLMTALYVEKWGGIPHLTKIVPDEFQKILEAVKANLKADMILLIGGTSVGMQDHTSQVLENLGTLLVHGVGLIPGKPTALGVLGEVPVVCVPGYPVAGLAALYFFARPGFRKRGSIPEFPEISLKKRLAAKISSKAGYVSFVRVGFEGEFVRPQTAEGAGALSSVTKADGFVLVPENVEGYEAGDEVDVFLIE